jgi:hypothetical protein
MNVMSSANLRGVVRDPQQHEGVIVLRRIVVMVVAASATLLVDAGAGRGVSGQIGRRGRQQGEADPGYWVGLSLGYVDGTTINDGDTGTTWQFGYTAQIRATLEKTLQRGVTFGASAGFSDAPLTYVSGFADPHSGCVAVCAARANITQLMAFIHGGGSSGFHFVYDLEGGVTEFSDFRTSSTQTSLAPASTYDFTFGFGGGLGYGFSQISDIYVSEMSDLVLHPSNGASTTAPRLFQFRAGFRVGF